MIHKILLMEYNRAACLKTNAGLKMHDGTLYKQKGTVGTSNVDVQVDVQNFQNIGLTQLGGTVKIDSVAIMGYTGNQGQIYIQKNYEELFLGGACLSDVQITHVNGVPFTTPSLFPQNISITLTGICE
jgi:hypothetical protein